MNVCSDSRAVVPRWSLRLEPRTWQKQALNIWLPGMQGVVSVVTGGGKTVFAFLCVQAFRKLHPVGRVFIVVPTMTLLDQWRVDLQEDFGVPSEEIACFSSQEMAGHACAINLLVINTARRKIQRIARDPGSFLIVDECHRAGSTENAKALRGEFAATLGLSATPQREYDTGLEEHVLPVLGPIIYKYGYRSAYRDGIITPFDLINVRVSMLQHEQRRYDKLTKRVRILIRRLRSEPNAASDSHLKRLLQMRAAVSATAMMRLPVAVRLLEEHRGARAILFHERVRSAENLFDTLKHRNHSVCVYHSRVAPEIRRDNLRLFRRGIFDVLISCRALDEGMNVPETTVAIIVSSTASQRQRIQRLGRVLRPAKEKIKAVIYTLYATDQEYRRLREEAAQMRGVARVRWLAGTRKLTSEAG